jgi:serine/threonine protein kinase
MVTKELQDEDAPTSIRDFVRNTTDIEVNEYVQRGCNGEVYFGKRVKMNDEVVLKFYGSYPGFVEGEEAVILQSIEHPNILKIYDLRFVAPCNAYFLTPKISGGDLQGIIDNRRLSSKTVLEIISGILLGLTELHSKHKLVHRDLKPGNILLDLESNSPIIADLGAVKKIDKADGCVTASKSTYFYLPPEAISSNEYFYQSDIYQVGVIMFQLLGGFFPINSPMEWLSLKEKKELESIKNPTESQYKFEEIIGLKILKGQLININSLPNYLDLSFKRVLRLALNPDHKKRYRNTSLFLKDVHNLLRKCPDYIHAPDRLIIKHETGKEFQIFRDTKKELVLEKRKDKKEWRKDKSHDGTIDSALKIARTK